MKTPRSQTGGRRRAPRLASLLAVAASLVGLSAARANVQTGSAPPPAQALPAAPAGPEFPGIDLAAAFDPDEPDFDLTSKGLKARLFQGGDFNVDAELSAAGRLRLQASWRDVTLAAESSFTGWRVSLGFPQRLPLTNVVLLDERMEAGMTGVHVAVESTERLGKESMQATGQRLRPYARSLRLAGEALSTLSQARPGWIVGMDLRGKVYQPLGLTFEPEMELQATATLIF